MGTCKGHDDKIIHPTGNEAPVQPTIFRPTRNSEIQHKIEGRIGSVVRAAVKCLRNIASLIKLNGLQVDGHI